MNGGAIFTLTDFDISPITSTISANAPIIIGAGITITLTIAAVKFIPRLVKGAVKG
ncbi:hypothetical protein MHB42_20610 [Lysinibacillus sp. FSL K6-0232]|uniref:hypothetical protein n=1 Tax=Lysinibacillus sp. FSL K6-0232 TaxID=2921425 RepID=UPI0030F788B7